MQEKIHEAVQYAFRALTPVALREQSECRRVELAIEFTDQYGGGYQGKDVLELGSSLGLQLITAKRLGAQSVTGLDKYIFHQAESNVFYVSPQDLARLREVWSIHGIAVESHDLAERLPYSDGVYDLVVCNAVLEHVQGIHRHIFEEVRRVLRPGGYFVYTTPNLASLLKRIRFLVGRTPLWDLRDFFDAGKRFTGHIREFTAAECRLMLMWSGFEPVRIITKPTYFRWSWLWDRKKFIAPFFQIISALSPRCGDTVFSCGRKPLEH